MGEHPLLAADHEHRLVLEALGVVQGHQRAEALVVREGVLVGVQGDLCEELLQRADIALALELAVGVELGRHADQLLEVLARPSASIVRSAASASR